MRVSSSRWVFSVAVVMFLGAAQGADQPAKDSLIRVGDLMAPRGSLAMRVRSAGQGRVERQDGAWHITGKSPLTVQFEPDGATHWDLSGWRLAGVALRNLGRGVLTAEGRLDNSEATVWWRHCLGCCVTPAGEKATLGFILTEAAAKYHGPDIFKDQIGKPNGQRGHWREFLSEDVRVLRIDLRSSSGQVDLLLDDPFLAWQADPARDQQLFAMPYLDELGQVRALDWPGKAHGLDALKTELAAELKAATQKAAQSKLDRFGGYTDGPKLKSTGRFRTEKVDGKWWLVDPDGHLFFSVGVCSVGAASETPITPKRLDAGFFAYLPEKGDPLHWIGRPWKDGRQVAAFSALNSARALGGNWQAIHRAGIHDRMRAFGLNTLGAWSDPALQKDRRTPYTLIASPWWRPNNKAELPSPFRDDFDASVRKALERYLWAKDDPFCIGVFLGNEIEWPPEFTSYLYKLPETDSTKQWALGQLKKKYAHVDDVNAAWMTHFTSWDEVLQGKATPAARRDLEPLYVDLATEFFARNKKMVDQVLPGTLYLGCRVNRGTAALGRGALGHVDAFSQNVYECTAKAHQVPPGADLPIMVGEFHFGAVDRGVPSPGLVAAWDQRQRGLAFARYLASALSDPRFVGIHWFQWTDQDSAGRPDRENHQCGFVDITGRAYPEFAEMVSRATAKLYSARLSDPNPTPEKILEALLAQ